MYYSRKRQKSKKIFIALALIAAALFIVTSFFINKNSSDLLVAKVNGEKIYKSEVEAKLNDIFRGPNQNVKTPEIEKLPKEVLEILVKEVYLEKELVKEAKKSDLDKNQLTKSQIEQAKNRILRQAYIEKITAESVTDEKINNKYLELTKEYEGKKEYKISHIVLKTKEEAEDIIKKIKSKKFKFSELAKKYSIDRESAEKGGDLDFIVEDNLIKEISEIVVNLKSDEISDPVQTKFGWHIIRLDEVRDAKILPFENLKETIKEQLKQEVLGQATSKFTNNLKLEILINLENADEEKVENQSQQPSEETTTDNTTQQEEAVVSEENSESEQNKEKDSETKSEAQKEEKSAEKSKSNAKSSKEKSKKSH